MKRCRGWGGVALLLAASWAFAEGEPRFGKPPTVSRQGADVRISFELAAPTDVAVTIEDAAGRVVRHLAAGVLGPNAPAPLRADSLAQSILWDGQGDWGRPAGDGQFTVRVAAGMQPTFGGFIGYHPTDRIDSVRALATDAEGNVYVFYCYGGKHNGDNSAACIVLDRDGKYLRQIIPHPAGLPEEKLAGLKRIRLRDGSTVPFLSQVEVRSILPGMNEFAPHRAVVTRDGRLAFSGILELGRSYGHGYSKGVQITLRTDGSVPEKPIGATMVDPGRGGCLALSPDEKTLYATGVYAGGWGGRLDHVVYRWGWSDTKASVFLGEFKKPGSGPAHFSSPSGIAVDANGMIYVADFGNDRIAVFDADGKWQGALTVEKPVRVEVDAAKGTLYVLAGDLPSTLMKFASWKDAEPVATLDIPTRRVKDYTAVTAIDTSGEKPVLWIGSPDGDRGGPYSLLRVEDLGDRFSEAKNIFRIRGDVAGAGTVVEVSLNKQTGSLLMNNDDGFNTRYYTVKNAATESVLKWHQELRRFVRGPGSIGWDGNFYALQPHTTLWRFDAGLNLKPFTVNAGDKGELKTPPGNSWRTRARGVTADRDGNVYVLLQTDPQIIKAGFKRYAGEPNSVVMLSPDGAVTKTVVKTDFRCVCSPRVDPAGNVYLMAGVRPGDARLPKDFKGQIPPGRKDPDAVRGINGYPLLYGSILKFGPEGGQIGRDVKGVPVNLAFGVRTYVAGAKFIYAGASPAPSWRTAGTVDICLCESARFDVDGFGRSFFPDVGRFRIGVIDTNGNQITHFGTYGNQDAAGAQIPLRYPYSVAADARTCYVADRLNRRVVRVRIKYAAEKTLAIPR